MHGVGGRLRAASWRIMPDMALGLEYILLGPANILLCIANVLLGPANILLLANYLLLSISYILLGCHNIQLVPAKTLYRPQQLLFLGSGCGITPGNRAAGPARQRPRPEPGLRASLRLWSAAAGRVAGLAQWPFPGYSTTMRRVTGPVA